MITKVKYRTTGETLPVGGSQSAVSGVAPCIEVYFRGSQWWKAYNPTDKLTVARPA